MMYWHIGERINREILGNQRAEYGKQIVSAVSTQLQAEYGKKGFEPRSIWRMMQFAQEFPDEQIVAQPARQLSWSHFIEVLPLKDDLQREFYRGAKGSNHLSGCAVDIRVTGIEQAIRYANALLDIAEGGKDFDELLIERSSKGTYWLHLAVKPSNNRRRVRLLFPS